MASLQTDPLLKELTRKLFWAVCSTFPHLSRDERSQTFSWAVGLADKIMARPSASRLSQAHQNHTIEAADEFPWKDKRLKMGRRKGGGGGRSHVSSVKEGLSAATRLKIAAHVLTDFKEQQRQAIHYMLTGQRRDAQLPIPSEVYREVGRGSSDSSGS